MSIPINDVALLLILTAVQVTAIIFTIKMGKVFGSKSWNFITTAFIILLIIRIISFLNVFGVLSYGESLQQINQVYLPLIFWILVGIGMARLYYNIRSSLTLDRRLKRAKDSRRR